MILRDIASDHNNVKFFLLTKDLRNHRFEAAARSNTKQIALIVAEQMSIGDLQQSQWRFTFWQIWLGTGEAHLILITLVAHWAT